MVALPEMLDGFRFIIEATIVFCGVLKFFKVENVTAANKLFDFFRPKERIQRTLIGYHGKTAMEGGKLSTNTLIEKIICIEFDEFTPVFQVHITTGTVFLI